MKLMILFFLLSISSFAQTLPRLRISEYDCIDGIESMEIEIKSQGQFINFEPSCSQRFYEEFSLPSGTNCIIESTMCSEIVFRNRIYLNCGGKQKHSKLFRCINGF